jgi:hypothetical protein
MKASWRGWGASVVVKGGFGDISDGCGARIS